MKQFMIENWQTVGLAAVIVAFVLYLVITKQWVKLRESAYKLMLTAQKVMETDEGKAKMDMVLQAFYMFIMPKWAKRFWSAEDVRKQLQKWYDKALDWLEDGTVDNAS